MSTTTSGDAVTREWIEEFSRRWLAGWNDHDPDALAELCHPEIVWEEPGPRRILRGREDVRPWLRQNFVSFPDLEIETLHEYIEADQARAAGWWRLRGTHDGPLDPPGFAPTGRRVEFEGVDFWEFRDGLLSRLRMIYDLSDVAVQLGLAPRPGGAAERGMVALQRAGARLRR